MRWILALTSLLMFLATGLMAAEPVVPGDLNPYNQFAPVNPHGDLMPLPAPPSMFGDPGVRQIYEQNKPKRDRGMLEFTGSTIWTGTIDLLPLGELIIALNYHGLQIFAADDLSEPVREIPLLHGYYSDNLHLDGDYLYVGRSHYLHIFDISNPDKFKQMSVTDVGGDFMEIEKQGDNLFLGGIVHNWGGTDSPMLFIYDVSDVEQPQLVSSYTHWIPLFDCRRFAIVGDYLYGVSGVIGHLVTFDISDLEDPVLLPAYALGDSAWDIVYKDGFLYTISDAGLYTYEVTGPGIPTYRDVLATTGNWSLEIYNDVLIADHTYGIRFFAIDPPNPLQQIGVYDWDGGWYNMAISDDKLFAPAALQGFKVLDIVDPTSPALIDSFSSPTWIMSGIAVEGDWVYATKYTAPPNFCHALHVIDASDKTDPQYVNGVPSAGRSNGVCTTADEVLVGGVLSGVYIYDRSSPAAPIQVGWIDTLAINIAVEDDIVFTTMLNNGLLAYDFSTPSSPVFVSSAPEYINVNGVLADGDYVYTMEMNVDSIGYYGCPFYLRVLDFSDLQNPQAVGFCPLGLAQPFYYSFAKYSHYLYLPRGDSGVAIADVSDPTQPTLVGSYLPLAGRCSNITVAGGYLYLSIVEGALEVLSLANPTAPFLVDFDVYPSSVEFTCVQDDYLYVNATTAVYLYHLNYPPVECGDLNGDGLGNVTDVVYLINFIFSDGPPPAADGVGDVDCDGITNITDAVYLIAYIFSAGAAPCADCP